MRWITKLPICFLNDIRDPSGSMWRAGLFAMLMKQLCDHKLVLVIFIQSYDAAADKELLQQWADEKHNSTAASRVPWSSTFFRISSCWIPMLNVHSGPLLGSILLSCLNNIILLPTGECNSVISEQILLCLVHKHHCVTTNGCPVSGKRGRFCKDVNSGLSDVMLSDAVLTQATCASPLTVPTDVSLGRKRFITAARRGCFVLK